MLLKMVPEAISAAWDQISYHIERALPEDERTDTTLNNLLEMFLTGQATCWVSYNKDDKNQNFIMTLVPVYNGISGTKNLLIYNITNSSSIDMKTSNRMWLEGFVALKKYMKDKGFTKLVSYFDKENYRSLRMAERFGADVKYYIEIDMTREG